MSSLTHQNCRFSFTQVLLEITPTIACWVAGEKGVMTLRERRGDLMIQSSGEKVDLEVSKLEKGCLQRVLITCV